MAFAAGISRRLFLECAGASAIPLMLSARVASAQHPPGAAAPASLIPVRDFILEKVGRGIVPSLVVQVTRGGQPIWAEAFGFADLEVRRPATLESIYKIMSITKSFTVSALMTLVDRGILEFDAPANRYLRGPKLRAYRGSPEQMTLRRLANHTSGIPDHEILFFDRAPRLSPELTVERYGFAAWRPGSRFEYSNLIRRNFNHSGGGPGGTAMLAAFPEDHTVIAVLSNHYGGMVTEVTRRIAAALYGGGTASALASAAASTTQGPPALGRWSGVLRHHSGDIPVALEVPGSDTAEIRFARMPPMKMTNVSASNGLLGTVVGPLMRDPGYHGDSIIDFVLRVEDGRLVGIADTYAMNYFEVAYWVELNRTP